MKNTSAVTCIAGTTSGALFDSTWTFTSPSTTGSSIDNIKIGPINYSLYLWGSLYGATNTSFLRKLGRDDSVFWTMTSPPHLAWTGFDVDYTETYLYAIINENPGGFMRFKVSDGKYYSSKVSSSFDNSAIKYKYSLTMSTSAQIVFFSAFDGQSTAYLWRWIDPNTKFTWISDTSSIPAGSIFFYSSSVLYIATLESSSFDLEFTKVDFFTRKCKYMEFKNNIWIRRSLFCICYLWFYFFNFIFNR